MGTQQLVFISSTQRMQFSHFFVIIKKEEKTLQEIRAEKKNQREKNNNFIRFLFSFKADGHHIQT